MRKFIYFCGVIKRVFLSLLLSITVACGFCATPADDGRSSFTTSVRGLRVPVVLVEFADRTFARDDIAEYLDNILNNREWSNEYSPGCAAQYFEECSNGKFSTIFDIAKVKLPMSAAGLYKGNKEVMGKFLHNVMQQMPALDFARYDYNQDGILDTVIFIYAGTYLDKDNDMFGLWCHHVEYTEISERYTLPSAILNGKLLGPCAVLPEFFPDGSEIGIGAICHEVGHMLGLPDWTNFTLATESRTPGTLSVMDNGYFNMSGQCPPLFSAYEKWYCRWAEIDQIQITEDPKEFCFGAFGTPDYKVGILDVVEAEQVLPNEYYIFETRHRSGWDASLPEEGLFIWHVIYYATPWSGNIVNSYGNSRLYPIYSDESRGLYAWPSESGVSWWISGCNDELEPHSQVAEPFTPCISYVSYDADAKTVRLIMSTRDSQPKTAAQIQDAKISGHRDFNIYWEEPTSGDGVLLSVWKENRNGDAVYVDGCKSEFYRRGVNMRTFKNISDSDWLVQHYAAVIPVDVYPSKQAPEEYEFIPSKLPYEASIEDVYDTTQNPVSYYTLSGIKLLSRPTRSGIYIEKTARRVRKIVIQ